MENTCKMIEETTIIICSECGVRLKDEIYYMFYKPENEFNYCPCCGSKIIHTYNDKTEQL